MNVVAPRTLDHTNEFDCPFKNLLSYLIYPINIVEIVLNPIKVLIKITGSFKDVIAHDTVFIAVVKI